MLVVADGMGGNSGGGLAAETAIDVLDSRIGNERVDAQALAGLVLQAGEAVTAQAASNADLEGMGTTLLVVVVRDGQVFWAHAGDSRLYRLGGGALTQVTRDHRFLQDLLDSGDVTLAELPRHPLRSVLDQCVGCPGLEPDCGGFPVSDGDLLVLTTDGVHDHVDQGRMLRILNSEHDLAEMAQRLISEAVEGGSTDDLSVVLCRICRGEST